jgi:hypothetical protein
MLIEDAVSPKIHELSVAEWRVVRSYAPGLGILSATGDPWYDPTRQAVWSTAGGWSRVFLGRQARNGVRRQRATTGTRKVVSLEVPESLSPDAAAKIAWIQLRTASIERDRFRFSLPPRYLALDPGDVVEVAQADPAASPHTLRLLQVTLGANLRLELEGVLQLEGLQAPDAAVALGGGEPLLSRPIPVSVPAEATLWNGPVLSPALDNDGGFYFLAGPRRELAGTDYRGAALLESVAGNGAPTAS